MFIEKFQTKFAEKFSSLTHSLREDGFAPPNLTEIPIKVAKKFHKQKPLLKTSQPLLQEIKTYFCAIYFFANSHRKNCFCIFQINKTFDTQVCASW